MKKIALIGIGKMGLSHLAIANQTPGIEIVGLCDTSKPLLRFVEKNTDFQCFSDYKKMIDQLDIDGIMVLVPNSFHYEITKYCIEHGLHVFVEKPFTLSYKESKELVELAQKHHVKGQVGYVNRFNLMFHRVKELLDHNVIGDVCSYVNRMSGGVVTKENKGWRNDYAKGGGCLFDYGPHCFDLATYFFGEDVKVTSSELKRVFSSAVDDIVISTFVHKGTVTGINYINWSDSSTRKASNSIEIMGTKGKIIANKQELSIFLSAKNDEFALEEGWNQRYITDENTNVGYYLRGEDFSLQLLEFSKLLNSEIDEARSSLYSASITDKLLEEIKSLSGGLR